MKWLNWFEDYLTGAVAVLDKVVLVDNTIDYEALLRQAKAELYAQLHEELIVKLLEETKLSGFKMSVPSGSEAKKYAKSNGISYTVTDFNLLKWAFIVLCFALLAAAVVFGVVLMSRSRKSAPRRVRNAQKREKAKAFENSYKKIIDDDEPENKQAPLKKTSGNKKTSDNEKPSGSNKASGSSKSSGGKKSAGNKSKK